MLTISLLPVLSRRLQIIFLFPVFLLSIACASPSGPLYEEALKASGDNRAEWDKVMAHYRNDSLKTRAARFLIGNMLGKYYLAGGKVDRFHAFIDSVYQIRQAEYDEKSIYEAFRKQESHARHDLRMETDLEHLTAGYLIRQIDEAFEVWKKPWNRHLTFDEFAEWVLPYRVGNELPEDWRRLYRETFAPALCDTLGSAEKACRAINARLMALPIHIFLSSVRPSDIRPSSLQHIKFGLCEDYAALAVFAMRAAGIPVGIAFIPHWGRKNNNHTFNVVYTNDGRIRDFSGGEQQPGEHLSRFSGIPKVYLRTYGLQPSRLALLEEGEELPPFFRNPCLVDVTGQYPFIHPVNISVPLLSRRSDKKLAYLCVFDPAGWIPVDYGRIVRGEAAFHHVGPDIMYQAAYYEKGRLVPASLPFFADTAGRLHPIRPDGKKITLLPERKQQEAENLAYIPPTLVGSRFQASDDPDFRQAEDLYVFTAPPAFKYTQVEVRPRKAYRYYRYLSSDQTQGNMAEVEFYEPGNGEPLKGRVIGTEETSIYHPEAVKEHVFDGDALTYFHTRDTLSWAGLALDRPARVDRVRYIIRNDDNGVRKGNLYELFYIDAEGGWRSAGRKKATQDDCIRFDTVPSGTLYWLRNLTRGKEERIFTYEEGKQVWW